MSVTSSRSIVLGFTGDVEYSQIFEAANSSAGSGQNQLVVLEDGDNTITVPENAVAVTIILPDDNDIPVLLKVDAGDVGWPLALVGPSSISMDEIEEFILNADADDATVTVRLIYS